MDGWMDGWMLIPFFILAYLPLCLPVCLPTHLPICLPTHLPAYLPAVPPLQVNVYALGNVYLQLCALLKLEDHPALTKPIDPSLYIHRFSGRLNLGPKVKGVGERVEREGWQGGERVGWERERGQDGRVVGHGMAGRRGELGMEEAWEW